MAVNVKNSNCNSCKYAGIHLCTNSTKCVNNNLYVKK